MRLAIRALQRSMHSAEQPANSQCNDGSRIRLGFDCVAQPCVERRCRLTSHVAGLSVKLLCSASRLVHCAFDPGFGIAGYASDALLNPATILPRSTFNLIFVHDKSPVRGET